jgi:hypothetical protein
MNLKLGVALVIGVVFTTSFVAQNSLSAQEAPEDIYVGLWQGVDEVDGGYSIRSILPTESGFRVVGRDTWHGPCGYGDPATVLAQLTLEEENLEGTWNLDCQVGETAETGDRSFGVRYSFDPETQTLTETLLSPEGEPIDRIPIVFFRVSP